MRKKRILSIVLTLAMLVGMFPDMSLTASAAGETKEITPTNTSGTMTITLTIPKKNPTAPTGLTATYGQTLADVTLPTGWTWADSTQSVGNVVSPASTFKANFAGDDNYNAASNVDVAVTVSKAANPATVASTATVTKGGKTINLAGSVTLNGATGAVTYAIPGDTNGCTLNGSVLTSGDNAGSVTVNVTVAADNNYNALDTKSINVTISDKDTQTITASDVTASYGDTSKKVTATTSGNGTISYAVKSGSEEYIDIDAATGALTIKKIGTAIVIITAAETGEYAQATKEVTVTINKASAVAATVTANNRTYDGMDKPLVNVTGTATGGTMQYVLGSNATNAPTENWSTTIPTGKDAKTYYVWYKAVGDETHTDSEAKCITVTISSESNGGSGGSSSSGGGSSTPSTPTTPTESYTVPVSSENTVNVTTNISNGTAVVSEITQSDIDKIVDNGNNSGGGDNTGASENTSITIDVSQAKSEVTSVQLSEKTVEKLTEAVKADNNVESVEIKMTNATIELDGAALSAVSEQAEGSSIKLVVEDTQTTKLNATQQESLKQFASAKPFQAYFESNGKEIHDFKGGKATVSIKFSPESGRDVKHYHMYYLPVAGAIERYVTRYVDGMLSFVTTHFSDYAIVYDETMENETGKDDGTGGGSSETGGESNGNTANGKTTYQNAISINKGLKVSQTGSKINVSWGKVSGADRYEIYAAYCTDKFGKKPVKIVTKKDVTSVTITKLNGKKLVLTKNFKAYVVAYKTVDGSKKKLGRTITAHIVGRKNKTYTNVKAIKLAKNKATIKVGKTYKIKASVVLVDSKKKMLSDKHAATFRYASSDKKIATVDKNGKVTAKKKGTCYVWIYAKNGYANKVKVTVK
ncbi:Ig-like domain (group 2) [Lachnospiraceae bacterium XBB1006]|nr:Ig-like domain (group 2) [Lachnospiraceae bacterium XBB1006]